MITMQSFIPTASGLNRSNIGGFGKLTTLDPLIDAEM